MVCHLTSLPPAEPVSRRLQSSSSSASPGSWRGPRSSRVSRRSYSGTEGSCLLWPQLRLRTARPPRTGPPPQGSSCSCSVVMSGLLLSAVSAVEMFPCPNPGLTNVPTLRLRLYNPHLSVHNVAIFANERF